MGNIIILSIVVFIDGPMGSGKTTMLEMLRAKATRNNVGFVEEGFLVEGEDLHSADYSRLWLSDRLTQIKAESDQGKTLIFVDSSPLIALLYHPEINVVEAMAWIRMIKAEYTTFLFMIDITMPEMVRNLEARNLSGVDHPELREGLNETNRSYIREVYNKSKELRRFYDGIANRIDLMTFLLVLMGLFHFFGNRTNDS